MATKTRIAELWEPVSLKENVLYQVDFSTLTVWLKRSGEDWYLASRRSDKETAPGPLREIKESRIPKDPSFSRWVVGGDLSTVQFIPAMPDRSIVVRPAAPLRVPADRDALFFTSIPVWVRVTAGSPEGITLCELPSLILSNTWFGEPTAGELCYALRTGAVRTLEEIETRAYAAICPVTVRNRAPKELNFERLCVRVEYLSVYQSPDRLWTNELDVRFQGEEQSSQITIGREAPGYAKQLTKVCGARQPAERTLLKQSFSVLRSLTGF
jgi:hypothetical protein